MAEASAGAVQPQYRAFISYSHRDQAWARWLLAKLEGYRVHADLVGKPNQDGEPVPERLGRFFRDRDDASAASDLGNEIRRALNASANLIVIASPNSARSRYVDAEIREFHAINSARPKPGRILTLIVAGEPHVSAEGQLDPRECFAPALRGGLVGAEGRPFEPLAADARSTGDGRTRAVAKLVAGLLDIRYDNLVRRDLVRRRNRRLAISAATLLAIAVASGFGLRIEADRREKSRLEEVQQQTERDRRTLAAVNTAERARDVLATGNVQRAVALARQSLVQDGSLPFIPQAYGVLYQAYFQGAEPRNLDLIDYDDRRGLADIGLGAETRLIWSPRGRVSLWGPNTGITYVRSDAMASRRPTSTPDGGTVFLGGSFVELRYRAAANAWDQIVYSSMGFGYDDPTAEVALDATSLVACRNDTIFGIGVPAEGSGDAELTWEADLGGDTCSALALAPDGTVLIGTWSGDVIQFDPAKREQLTRYRGGKDEWVMWLDVGKQHFVASGVGRTAVFRFGSDEPLLTFDESSYVPPLSPDDRHVVEPRYGTQDEQMAIHDLETGKETGIDCVCSFEGFDEAGNLLTLERNSVAELRGADTGRVIKTLHRFDPEVSNVTMLGNGGALLGLREIGTETVVPPQTEAAAPLLAALPPGDSLSSAKFLDDSTIAAVVSHPTDGSTLIRRYDVEVLRRRADGHAETLWTRQAIGGKPYGYGEVRSLGHGLLALTAPDDLMGTTAVLRIVDAADGKDRYELHINAGMEMSAGGTHLVLEGDDGLISFDLVGRKASALDIADLGAPEFRSWAVAGNRLAAASGQRLVVLPLDAPDKSVTVDAGGTIYHVCAAGDAVFAVTETPQGGAVQRWSLTTGQSSGRSELDLKDQQVIDVLSAVLGMQRQYRTAQIACTSDRLSIRGLQKTALLWDVAAGGVKIVQQSALPPATPRGPPLDDAQSIDAATLARATLSFDDAAAYLSDPETGTLLRRFEGDASRIVSAAFLKRRNWVALGFENGSVGVWDVAAPTVPAISLNMHRDAVLQLDANLSGTAFLSADSGGTLRYWPALTVPDLLSLKIAGNRAR